VWLYLCKECLQRITKKLNPLRYRSFDIIKEVNINAFKLRVTPYMQISLVVNVEYMKLFKASMLDGEEDHHVLSTIE